MKKLVFLVAMAMAVVSCKKEAPLTPTKSSSASTDELVADLIKRADKDLYAQMYDNNQRMYYVGGVGVIHGIFYWTKDVASGTCLPHPTNPCMLLVTGLATERDSIDCVIEAGEYYTFTEEDNARLIRNTQNPVVEKISSIRTDLNANGETVVTITN